MRQYIDCIGMYWYVLVRVCGCFHYYFVEAPDLSIGSIRHRTVPHSKIAMCFSFVVVNCGPLFRIFKGASVHVGHLRPKEEPKGAKNANPVSLLNGVCPTEYLSFPLANLHKACSTNLMSIGKHPSP